MTQVTDDNRHSYIYGTADTSVVWMASDGFDNEIYRYDGVSTTKLSDNRTYESCVGVAPGRVGWVAKDASDDEVFLFDNGHVQQITHNNDDDDDLATTGSLMAWVDRNGPNRGKVHIYDGVTTTLLAGSYNATRVKASGPIVMWTDSPPGESYQTRYYDGTTTRVLSEYLGYSSNISGNVLIGGVAEGLVAHDIAAGTRTVVTSDYSSWRIGGDYIVWETIVGAERQLSVYDGATTLLLDTAADFKVNAGPLGVAWTWDDGNDVEVMLATYVPEPATLTLLATAGLAILRRRKRQAITH